MQIRRLRERLGMSMADLADRMNVSVPTVSRWETGEAVPVTGRLDALAGALHCTIDELFHDPDSKTPPAGPGGE